MNQLSVQKIRASFSVCQLPPPLKPPDLLRVIVPSGTLREVDAFNRGIEIWRSRGYHVQLPQNWNAREGYLAGTDSQRRQQLLEACLDPKCRGILCARGGYGSARLLEDWTWPEELKVGKLKVEGSQDNLEPDNLGQKATLREQPVTSTNLQPSTNQPVTSTNLQPSTNQPVTSALKWLIGFSDITALLWSLGQIGVSGVHGPLLTTIAGEPEWSLNRLFDWVEGRPIAPLKGVGWGGGKVSGVLLPANLTVATHLLGTPLQPSLSGVILALEDVTEAPYRIDRMLTQWRMSGAMAGVKGIALGRFSRCAPPKDVPSWSVEEVLRDRIWDLGIPVVSDLPFGHDGVNAALPVGQLVELDAEAGTLSWVGG
ncbi:MULTISPECIES: LD-carboxypeptidase [unclassified Moorena]|uniref:S66 peptidase family protein n=1 Tax=unclassified Moorena TaxID=2683338 RepID=UPI0013CA4722|nr:MULTISPECIES: LD-carboxypeptidase [unclassified Moorena]NEO20152.1 LD-carboxypeptidase [Moorena sp. SIO4A5]NEP24856.1 LD-carboxypeptidase [Moorena sp. SIO3I6]NEQ59399.1 LD-carboxypeptidase [Moorena sp. SIO4A1]